MLYKYEDWCKITYDNLMRTRQTRDISKFEYLEKHHIVPKALGGKNDKSNIVYLTPREHLIAHMLLAKIHKNNNKIQLAILAMLKKTSKRSKDEKYIELTASKSVEELRINARKALSVSRQGSNNPMFGRKHTEESKKKMSENSPHTNKGKHLSEEQKQHLREIFSGKNSPTYGKHWSKEHNEKISQSRKNRFIGKDNPFFGKTHTEEAKRRMSEARLKNVKKVIDKSGEILSIKEMAKKNKVSYSTIVYWILHHPEYGISYYVG